MSRRVPATCAHCGRQFNALYSQISLGLGKYCSPKCGAQTPLRKDPPRPGILEMVEGKACMRIPLTKGYSALVDTEDYERINQHAWHAAVPDKGTVYAARHPVRGVTLKMHQAVFPDCPSRLDHKNGNGLDNRKSNLRPATPAQNSWNRKPSINGRKGIYFSKSDRCWIALIMKNGERKRIGGYKLKSEAQTAYNSAAESAFGEFAKTVNNS